MMLGNTRLFPVSRNLLETAAKMRVLVASPVLRVPPRGFQTKGSARYQMQKSSLKSASSPQTGSKTLSVEHVRGAVREPRLAFGLIASGDPSPAMGRQLRAHPAACGVPGQEGPCCPPLPRVPSGALCWCRCLGAAL